MSVSSHTDGADLRLLHGAEGAGFAESGEHLKLSPTAGVQRFLDAAAVAGLDRETAIRLGVERFLVLIDGALYGLTGGAVRAYLNEAAGGARARLPLGPREANQLRRLTASRPFPDSEDETELVVLLPERMLTRFRQHSATFRLNRDAVEEMLAWEIAAKLEGRTMTEWALRVLAERQAA